MKLARRGWAVTVVAPWSSRALVTHSCTALSSMRSLSLLVGLLLLSCSVIAAAEVWEPCANASTLTLSNGYSRLEANGYNARVATVASNGTVLPVYISLEIQAIQEWLVDSPQRECLFIGSPYAPGTRLSYLTAYRSLLMDDFQCKSDLLNLTLPNGVAAEQISIVMRHEVFSNFTFTFNWTRSHGEYEETYPGSANSAFKSVVHRYKYVASRYWGEPPREGLLAG